MLFSHSISSNSSHQALLVSSRTRLSRPSYLFSLTLSLAFAISSFTLIFEEKMLTMTFKARNGFAPSYLAELLRDYSPLRALRSSNNPTLAVPTFKLKTVGDRSFCASGPRAWNSLPPSLSAGALACTDATPGTVSALLRCYLMATHFDGFSPDSSSLPATPVMRSLRKRVDSTRGSVLAIKNPPSAWSL